MNALKPLNQMPVERGIAKKRRMEKLMDKMHAATWELQEIRQSGIGCGMSAERELIRLMMEMDAEISWL